MPSPPLIDLAKIDLGATVAGPEEIRKANPQRFEMEQVNRIVFADDEAGEVAGVLEVGDDPWWSRGHVPGRPLMPGVLMIEAAAQACSYLVRRVYDPKEYGARFFGFAGVDAVKFRGTVFPGQTVLLLGKLVELRPRRALFDTQAFVDGKLVYEGRIIGMWV